MESDISLHVPSDTPAHALGLHAKQEHAQADFAAAVLAGLARTPRTIPCRFFYDAAGCELFEEIVKLEEYYPTRVEAGLLEAHGAEIAELAGKGRVLVEFGSGSSRKTSLLIGALGTLPAYIPVDIAGESLREAAEWLLARHAELTILPLIADFTKTRTLPKAAQRYRKLGFFSGSTIGNLTHIEAQAFLANAAKLLGPGSVFLIGVDLKKPTSILLPAYNDARGVTAAFNLNLLARINRELDGDFDLAASLMTPSITRPRAASKCISSASRGRPFAFSGAPSRLPKASASTPRTRINTPCRISTRSLVLQAGSP
jgi:dimethylhistidine N-methyltransferase